MAAKTLDWLAQSAMDAITQARPDMASWCTDRSVGLRGKDRLDALRFIVNQLDAQNQRIVCEALGINPDDLHAVQRVLQRL